MVEVVVSSEDARVYEFPTLGRLWGHCHAQPQHAALYFHNKVGRDVGRKGHREESHADSRLLVSSSCLYLSTLDSTWISPLLPQQGREGRAAHHRQQQQQPCRLTRGALSAAAAPRDSWPIAAASARSCLDLYARNSTTWPSPLSSTAACSCLPACQGSSRALGSAISHNVASWRRVLEHFTLTRWRQCVEQLWREGRHTCGALLTTEHYNHYAGNFFWVRS